MQCLEQLESECSLGRGTRACYRDGLGRRGQKRPLLAKGWLRILCKQGNEVSCNCPFLSYRICAVFESVQCLVLSTVHHLFCLSVPCWWWWCLRTFLSGQCLLSKRAEEGAMAQSPQSIFERKGDKVHIHFNGRTLKAFQGGVWEIIKEKDS